MTESKKHIPQPKKWPRLVIPGPESKDQRWIIKMWVWDAQRQRIVMKQDKSSLQGIDNIAEKKREAARLCLKYTNLIREGYHIDAEREKREAAEARIEEMAEVISVAEVVRMAIADKEEKNRKRKKLLKPRSIKTYTDQAKPFMQWLAESYNSGLPVHEFTTAHGEAYLEWLQEKKGIGPRTLNNYLNLLNMVFNWAVNRKPKGLIKVNPAQEIQHWQNPVGKHTAYRPEQQRLLVDYMREKQAVYLWPTMLMYFTYLRSNEIMNLRVRDIGLKHPDQIYLGEEPSKNNTERFVTIPQQLQEMIDELEIKKYPADHFLISKTLLPGQEFYPANRLADRYRANVLNKLGFTKDYTWYSWKHTGVVMAFISGVPPAAIFRQGGWKDWNSFMTYLKSLGLFDNYDIKFKFPDPGTSGPYLP